MSSRNGITRNRQEPRLEGKDIPNVRETVLSYSHLNKSRIFLKLQYKNNSSEAPWLRHFDASLKILKCEGSGDTSEWKRPSADSDRLYMSVGGGDVIEVGHPTPRLSREDPR